MATLGVASSSKVIEKDEKKIKLQVFDTAGQERFQVLTNSYYKGCQGAILMYDVTNQSSYNNIATWATTVSTNCDPQVIKILVANKVDVDDDKRLITQEMGEKMAEKYQMIYHETSAKTGLGVNEAFDKITDLYIAR